MGDEENDVPPPEKITVFPLASADEWTADRDDATKVTAVAFVSRHSEHSDAARATMKELSAMPEYAGMAFKVCDADESPEVVKAASVSHPIAGLPCFFFLFSGVALEQFTGNNMEKLKVCAKAAELKKKELIVKMEKEKEEAAKRAAEEEAAAKAAAEAQEAEASA
uniref:Thioredoxin domain-containing protein n=1 Tax=Neobodo designis TaxID=312471 RepID=A0A7S1LMT6_NEODS|eukprot:CAMPEP_0174850594 /NCGR_PEP_ID=MMETSP1114-20130205/20302_1 /TAXON_ID=312471 /ORGANISM="Neobodo designis, Strain CCAP 1951/1" /LENGTH=165 /DNA_ID=CAMNT_0016085063 /DNA_START=39 /DNA_END=536 /DNA_ORIENTATION=+